MQTVDAISKSEIWGRPEARDAARGFWGDLRAISCERCLRDMRVVLLSCGGASWVKSKGTHMECRRRGHVRQKLGRERQERKPGKTHAEQGILVLGCCPFGIPKGCCPFGIPKGGDHPCLENKNSVARHGSRKFSDFRHGFRGTEPQFPNTVFPMRGRVQHLFSVHLNKILNHFSNQENDTNAACGGICEKSRIAPCPSLTTGMKPLAGTA